MSSYGYLMDYIDDPDTYKAVMFACNLLKKGNSYTKSIGVASNYYDVNPDDVRHFVSQRGRRKQVNIKNRKYKEDNE